MAENETFIDAASVTGLSFKLDHFEGPLDLLLQLISKHKLDIYDIPITRITDQYFEIINQMQSFNMDISASFLVMASQLLYIKSKMLLPKPQNDEEEEDPRTELALRLIEYKLYKDASEELRLKEGAYDDLEFKQQEQIKFKIDTVYSVKHSPDELVNAFFAVISRAETEKTPVQNVFLNLVGREKVSVKDKTNYLSALMKEHRRLKFMALFAEVKTKPEAIATFLAVLEMVKDNQLKLNYSEGDMDYIVSV